MSKAIQWVVQTKHVNPDDFYVKTDGSEEYSAYWIANAPSAEEAQAITLETAADLELGQSKWVASTAFAEDIETGSQAIKSQLLETAAQFKEAMAARLAAWVSQNGAVL